MNRRIVFTNIAIGLIALFGACGAEQNSEPVCEQTPKCAEDWSESKGLCEDPDVVCYQAKQCGQEIECTRPRLAQVLACSDIPICPDGPVLVFEDLEGCEGSGTSSCVVSASCGREIICGIYDEYDEIPPSCGAVATCQSDEVGVDPAEGCPEGATCIPRIVCQQVIWCTEKSS